MRAFKTPMLGIAILLFVRSGVAQTNNDRVPPTDFINQLEMLPSSIENDTIPSKVILTAAGRKYDVATYKMSRLFEGPVRGIGDVRKLNELIAIKQTSQYKILSLINSLRDTAIFLCRKDWDFGAEQPFQHKIAYSWGAKEYKVKSRPPGSGDNCSYKINGLDCSGFIYQLFRANGIALPKEECNAETERKPYFLKKYLAKYFGTSKFDVKDLGTLSVDEMQSGDIIYFKDTSGIAYHIAILFVNDTGAISLYQSLGQPNRDPDSERICKLNIDEGHGPIVKIVSKAFLDRYKHNYGCIRIIGADGQ
jgi:hypothetical protein